MCRFPGAMYACPGSTRSPCSASFTASLQRPFSLAAKVRVKVSGMCWVIRMAGQSGGSAARKLFSASVPPVEAPTAITFSVVEKCWWWLGSTASAVSFPSAGSAGGAFFAPFLGHDCRAQRILPVSSCAYSKRPLWMSILGLVTKSKAPSSRALRVTAELFSVREETMTTGIGRSRMSFSRKASPSILGISTSRVRTSGLSALIFSLATRGSGAVPTTSRSGSRLMISERSDRTRAESSMIRTLIGICFLAGDPASS